MGTSPATTATQGRSVVRLVPEPDEVEKVMFELSIATPEKVFYEDQVESVTAPGADGYLGVLAHHAPLITTLLPGKVIVRDKEKQTIVFAVSGGFLEVSRNKATLLADAVELAEQISVDRARRALARAQERIHKKEPGIDLSRALEALKRAENRMRIHKESYPQRA